MSGASSGTNNRGAKSAAAFRTISEVADELEVAQHVLRFWESKFPQVRPMKRGGGRRYYRPEDIDVLREIRALLYDQGYTIKGAQKLLREQRVKRGPTAAVAHDDAEPQTAPSDHAEPAADIAPTADDGDDSELSLHDRLSDIRARLVAARARLRDLGI